MLFLKRAFSLHYYPDSALAGFWKGYRRFFSIAEIETTSALKWFWGAIIVGFFLRFSSLVGSEGSFITSENFKSMNYTCWPFFQSCGEWYLFSGYPHGYALSAIYAVFFGFMALIAFFMWKQEWALAHFFTLPLFFWKFILTFVFSMSYVANFDYYQIILALIFLFFPRKLFFLRLTLVLLYFLASTVKFHEGWILGTYFTTLKTGLPIFPDSLTPLATNMVIFGEMAVSWFLLSSRDWLRRTALTYFTFFHLYSITLVGYTYPTIVLSPVLILFGMNKKRPEPPFDKKSLLGWGLIVFLFLGQLSHLVIRGDTKFTLEGNYHGLYMFEANHQCVSSATVYLMDQTAYNLENESISARFRCSPYLTWFFLQQICKRGANVERIQWRFDHSINGGPFYRIVDEENACQLQYHTLRHNEWIRLPEEGAEIIGYPVKNIYY